MRNLIWNGIVFLAEITREELQLDASAFIADIALPSLAGNVPTIFHRVSLS